MSKRIILKLELNNISIKVYRDSEWDEYQVIPFVDGVKQDDCASFHDSREDAIGSAQYQLDYFTNEG
jgi:hypothetical protein